MSEYEIIRLDREVIEKLVERVLMEATQRSEALATPREMLQRLAFYPAKLGWKDPARVALRAMLLDTKEPDA